VQNDSKVSAAVVSKSAQRSLRFNQGTQKQFPASRQRLCLRKDSKQLAVQHFFFSRCFSDLCTCSFLNEICMDLRNNLSHSHVQLHRKESESLIAMQMCAPLQHHRLQSSCFSRKDLRAQGTTPNHLRSWLQKLEISFRPFQKIKISKCKASIPDPSHRANAF